MSETDYLNQIQQLVELQKVDDEIHAIKLNMENAPRDLDELRRRFESLDNVRDVALDKLAHLQEQKKRLSLEIDDDSARIKKSKNKMMQVGNTREYNAMIREMDNMERSNRTREEERLALLEALEQQNENLQEIESSHSALKSDLEAKTATLDATLAEGADKLAVMEKKRLHFSEGIPRPIFMRYEFIRNRLEHPVIVSVDDGICSGCNIAIPPQTYIELQSGQQILSCPNCQRLIFWSQHFEDPAEIEERKRKRKSATRPTQDEEHDAQEEEELGMDEIVEDDEADEEEELE